MPPENLRTFADRLSKIESDLELHDKLQIKDMSHAEERMERIENIANLALQTAEGAKMSIQEMQTTIAGLPQAVIIAIKKENKEKGLELRDWLGLLVAIVVMGATLYSVMK